MLFSFAKWWSARQEKSRLKKDFLVARDNLVFCHTWLTEEDLCGEDFETAMKDIEARYRKLGLTQTEIDKVRKQNPFVRIE